ncbi:MAG: uroporphyrinogen decarboxylase family protein [Planctomycetota bacterium]
MNGYQRIRSLFDGRQADGLPWMPITMMFAADQIGVAYKQYATDYRTLVEGQLVTAERFDIDHVSVISDPSREAADCGASIQYFEDQPPAIDEINALLAEKSTLKTLQIPDPLGGGRMHDRVKAAALFKERVGGERYIEGWVEGPCAQAADLRGINRLMIDFFDDPQFVRDVFEFVVEMELRFARAQVDAGVDIIGMGDAAASLVGPQIYEEFVMPYEKRMIDALHAMGTKVRLHICGNTRRILAGMGTLGADMIDLDYPAPLEEARLAMGTEQILAGNIHPVQIVRNGQPETIAAALAECYRQAGKRYIVGAGCEIPRDTPAENVRAMHDFARNPTAAMKG